MPRNTRDVTFCPASASNQTVKLSPAFTIAVFEYAGGGLDYFDGQIDDVRYFDRTLSEAEISGLV